MTRTGLSALEHRHRPGTYPAGLQTLDIVDAADPFSGEPLAYQPRPTGFTPYCLGEDGFGDGGVGVKAHKGDLAWIYSE